LSQRRRWLKSKSNDPLFLKKNQSGGMEQFIAGAWTQASEPLFDFAPHVFNGVEIRGIGWQIEESGSDRLNGFTHAHNLVCGQIIHDHQIVRLQCGRQSWLHPG
jgi:hypothetical protein